MYLFWSLLHIFLHVVGHHCLCIQIRWNYLLTYLSSSTSCTCLLFRISSLFSSFLLNILLSGYDYNNTYLIIYSSHNIITACLSLLHFGTPLEIKNVYVIRRKQAFVLSGKLLNPYKSIFTPLQRNARKVKSLVIGFLFLYKNNFNFGKFCVFSYL